MRYPPKGGIAALAVGIMVFFRRPYTFPFYRPALAGLLLLFAGNALAEVDYRQIPPLTLRAQLYIKIGDYYAARQEYRRAAAAYQKASELAAKNLSPPEQLSLSERLVNVRDIHAAIANLEQIRADQPDNLNARLMLARYLAWDNRPREAVAVVDEALALAPDNRDARIIKATAASWYGDYATAVPLFEQVLDEREDFDTRLAYSYAMAELGNQVRQSGVLDQLRTDNDLQVQALEDLRWNVARKSAPNVQYWHEYYHDSFDNTHVEQRLQLEQPVRDSMVFLAYGQAEAADAYGYRFHLDMLQAGAKGAYGLATHGSAAIGLTRYDEVAASEVITSRLKLEHQLSELRLGLEYRHEAYDDFTLIVFNRITTDKTQLSLDYSPDDLWNARLEYLATDYSDDNRSREMDATIRYAVHHTPPRISIGYKREALSFERQTFHGYFDPDSSSADKLLLQLYQGGNRYELRLEAFVGHQDVSRLGFVQDDAIVGWEANLRLHQWRRVYLEANWEGGNYGVDKPYQYRYQLLSLQAKLLF
jgi:tetratricopeptide (TPR) repeat protein